MDFNKVNQDIQNTLAHHLERFTPRHSISEIYEYAVMPPGKAFRPHLVWSVYHDFASSKEVINSSIIDCSHAYISSAVEFHHAYTLVHDDMPCMDNDDVRRGKPSTHKAFGQWRALLVGDGLLNASYALLSNIKSKNSQLIFKTLAHCFGSKGLIQGQVLDLSHEMTLNFENLVETHKLKTARLMQASMLASYLAIDERETSYKTACDIFRLGHHIGVMFQLIDDLTELVDAEISQHEQDVNPWFRFKEDCTSELIKNMETIDKILTSYNMDTTRSYLALYMNKMNGLLLESKEIVQNHISDDLSEIMNLIKKLC